MRWFVLLLLILQSALDSLMLELIDDVTLGLCFEVHRACKTGAFFLADTDPQYVVVRLV